MLRIVFITLLCFLANAAYANDEARAAATSEEPTFLYSESPNDRTLGSEDAPHTLIVYASNMCPHCGQWFTQDWPVVKQDLVETGQLRFVFRAFPTQPVQLSLTGFIMAECAPDEDYMAIMEDQFARQRTILSAPDGAAVRAEFDAIAAASGLENDAEISACLNNEEHFATLEALTRKAQAADIRGVPAFIFDGQVMSGAHDASAVKDWVKGVSTQP